MQRRSTCLRSYLFGEYGYQPNSDIITRFYRVFNRYLRQTDQKRKIASYDISTFFCRTYTQLSRTSICNRSRIFQTTECFFFLLPVHLDSKMVFLFSTSDLWPWSPSRPPQHRSPDIEKISHIHPRVALDGFNLRGECIMAEKWMDKSHEWLVPAFYCPHKNSRRVGDGEEKLSIKLGNVVRSRFRTKYVRTRLIMGQFLFLRYGTRNRIVSESRISTNSQIMVWYWARYGSIRKKKCHACIDAQRAFYNPE